MVEIDWKAFLKISPETLSEREKEDIYHTVAWYNPEFDLDNKYLIHFIRVTQEVLKFKFEQVESLTNELDEVAVEQGKEEAGKLQQYKKEIERLQEELEYYKGIDKSNSRSTIASNEDCKRELVKLQYYNEELLGKLKEKEKDLMLEKNEVERFASQVAKLEREKTELSMELKVLHDEAVEKNVSSLKNSPELGAGKQEEFTGIIRQKNQHINQLLKDIEIVENENATLRQKLIAIKDELSESTAHMSDITMELSKLKHLNEEYEKKNLDSRDMISGLKFQIEELVEEKTKHDKQLDEYIVMINEKNQEWKKVIDCKDEEISQLKEEIKKLYSSYSIFPSDVSDIILNKKLLQQEEQIEILQQELQKATEEIKNSTELIEKLRERQMQTVTASMPTQSLTNFFEEKIKILEEKLKYAEEDAQVKAEDMSSLVTQLREYESNIFGLSEAVEKIRKLEKNIEKKNLQIEKLIEICNNLEIKLDNYEEQNMVLRERLGLSASEEIDTSGIALKFRKDGELIENLKIQLDKKDEELVKIKLKYHEVLVYLKTLPSTSVKLSPDHDEHKSNINYAQNNKDLIERLDLIIKENDALRKGMHEILESIRQQDSTGVVEVQSVCLERLLEALDSRHISGWYHPAMRLQAQLSTEEGKNDELRNQIRVLRAEEKKKASELQNAYLKIQSLENDLSTPRDGGEEEHLNADISNVEQSHSHNIQDSQNFEQNQRIIQLESELLELKMSHNVQVADMMKKEKSFENETEKLLSRIQELECQVRIFKDQDQNSDIKNVISLSSQVVVLERKVNYLKKIEMDSSEANENLRREIIQRNGKLLHDILKVQNQKSELLTKIEKLEKSALNAIPLEKYVSLSKELESIRAKYQNAVSLSIIKQNESENDTPKLLAEISLLENEKEALLDQLKLTKEKLIAAEGLLKEEIVTKGDYSNEISEFAAKLAAAEVREMNEKQRSSHLEKINDLLKVQQQELEDRNKELLEKVVKLMEENLKFQEVEMDLRSKLINCLSVEDRTSFEIRIENLEKRNKELTTEKENVQELFEISQGQCRAFQEWQDANKILSSSQKEQILLLQSSNDDKATISRLSHEVAMSKLLSSQLSKKNNDLKIKISKLLTQNLGLEVKIAENRDELFTQKKKHLAYVGYLHQTINDVRKLYGSAMNFQHLEDVYNKMAELKEKKQKVLEDRNNLKIKIREFALKKEEMETQLECLDDLKLSLRGDTKNLVYWHNKNTELRLRETKYRRESEYLSGEIAQLQNCIKRLNEELTAIEQENIIKEKEWDQKQLLWEEAQTEMCRLMEEKGIKKEFKVMSDAVTNTEDMHLFVPKNPSKLTMQEKIKVQELEEEVAELLKNEFHAQHNASEKEKEPDNLTEKSLILERDGITCDKKFESAEKEALKVTIDSLQNIIKQKEETILRYQDLLKEAREEHGKAYSKLQDELKELNESLLVQSRAYNKLKNALQANNFSGNNIPTIVEKYLTRIQELEEELRECQLNLSSINTQAYNNHQEVDKWRNLATERLLQVEDIRHRLEEEYKSEIENYKEEIKKYQVEVERLIRILEVHYSDSATRNSQKESQPIESNGLLSLCTSDKVRKQSLIESHGDAEAETESDSLKRQLKYARDECTRLREQLKLLQNRQVKGSRTAGSSTTRSDSRLSVREGSLTGKIKHLEELLTTSKEKEKELMDVYEKKLKSTEEVARWDERKKSQQTIKNLTVKLKEKETEIEVLTSKSESLRNIVYKLERDKSVLECQLKTAKGNSEGVNVRIEKLTFEKKQLETDLNNLKNKIEQQLRHSSGMGAALLQEKLEAQERKLASFELASRGQSAIVEEFEKLKVINSNLEKLNLKLESENLSLKLQLEREKTEVNCHDCGVISSLRKEIQNLKRENSKLVKIQKNVKPTGSLDKIRKDMAKLKEEHCLLRSKYMEAMDKNIKLEDEIKSYRYQIHLMEEKDLAEIIKSRSGFLSICDPEPPEPEIHQELLELRAKLEHKNQLLARVKALLIKAAAREKALLQESNFQLPSSRSAPNVCE